MKTLRILFFLLTISSVNAQDIFEAARSGDVKMAASLYKADPTIINSQNGQGYTPLVLASYYDREEFIEFLVSKEVQIETRQGYPTAVQACSYKGFNSSLEVLLEYGADPNLYDANGTSPLIYAAQFNHKEVVVTLLKYGANPEYKDPNGQSAIDWD